jgi:hypothetical protein
MIDPFELAGLFFLPTGRQGLLFFAIKKSDIGKNAVKGKF